MGGNHHLIDAYRVRLTAAAKSPQTVSLRCWQLRRLAEHHTLSTTTTAQLAAYLAGQPWSPATLYSVRATLRDFYRWAHHSRLVRTDPAAALPPIKVPRREPRPAPTRIIDEAACDDRTRLMIDLAARQGLRRAEIAAIHSRDLVPDLDGWSLIVHGKGRRERTIPLHADIAARLRAGGGGWAFPSPRGGHLSASRVGIVMSAALAPGWSAHSLRRSFATRLHDGGHDLRVVQRFLGHASVATTERYVGSERAAMRDALRWVA